MIENTIVILLPVSKHRFWKKKFNNWSLLTPLLLFLLIFFITKLLISGQQDIYSSANNRLYTLFFTLNEQNLS